MFVRISVSPLPKKQKQKTKKNKIVITRYEIRAIAMFFFFCSVDGKQFIYLFIYLTTIFIQDHPVQLKAGLNGGLFIYITTLTNYI